MAAKPNVDCRFILLYYLKIPLPSQMSIVTAPDPFLSQTNPLEIAIRKNLLKSILIVLPIPHALVDLALSCISET